MILLFDSFGKVKTLADTYLFSVACARAGVPLLLIAPPSGGKSTVIFAAEKYLRDTGTSVERVSRIGLRSLKELCDFLKSSYAATLVNEDYATLGSADYMVEKMGELIGALSYSGSYQDHGLKIDLKMAKLGFISGVQPLWIRTIMTHRVFSTHLREKFMRFYVLPCAPSEDVDDVEAISLLVQKTVSYHEDLRTLIPVEFLRALAFQVGTTRAQRFAPSIAREVAKLIPRKHVVEALRYFATRLEFERDFVQREVSDSGFDVETRWLAYHALYWVLRKGKVQREEFMNLLGVTSVRSVDRALEKALQTGWVTSNWNDNHKIFTASEGMIKRVAVPVTPKAVKKWTEKAETAQQKTLTDLEATEKAKQ